MSVKKRLLALKLLEKQKRNHEYIKLLGLKIDIIRKEEKESDLAYANHIQKT